MQSKEKSYRLRMALLCLCVAALLLGSATIEATAQEKAAAGGSGHGDMGEIGK